jgi:hypothetical protein
MRFQFFMTLKTWNMVFWVLMHCSLVCVYHYFMEYVMSLILLTAYIVIPRRPQLMFVCGSLFYKAFSVTILYSVNDRVTIEWWWWWIDEDKHSCLRWDLNPQSQRPSDKGLCIRLHDHWGWLLMCYWNILSLHEHILSSLQCSEYEAIVMTD